MRKSINEENSISSESYDIKSLADSMKDLYKQQKDLSEETYEMQQDSIKETAGYQKDFMNETTSYYKEMFKAGFSGISDSSKQAVDIFSGHAREVMGSSLSEVYDISKKMALSLGSGIKKMWDIRQERKTDKSEEFLSDISENQDKFTKKALTAGSIYTHDTTLESIIGDSNKVMERQKEILSSVEGIVDKGTEMSIKSKNILEKALDMLYDRGDEDERGRIDILDVVINIMNTLSKQAEDIQLMRVNQIEQMGALQKIFLPLQQSYFKYFRDSARGTEVVANRLVEIRRLLARAYGLSEAEVSVADSRWKLLGKIFLSPILLLKWQVTNIFKKIKEGFKKDDKQLTDAQKRNNLLFDILKNIQKMALDQRGFISFTTKKGVGRIGDTSYSREKGQGIKDMTKSVIDPKLQKSTDQQTEILESIKDYFLRKEKEEARSIPDKKTSWILKTLFTLGAIVGGIAGAIVLPFTFLYESIKRIVDTFKKINDVVKKFKPVAFVLGKISEWFGKIVESFKKLPVVNKIIGAFSKVGAFFGKISSIFKWIGGKAKLVFDIAQKIPILGHFFKGLMFGFKALAWPIRAIFMVIDFVKGFMTTEGDIIDKIKGGLMGVVRGFIELPVKLIGWIADWVLNLIGVGAPEGGSAEAIMNGIMKAVDVTLSIIMWPFRKIYDWMKSLIAGSEKEKEDVSMLTSIGNMFLGLGKKVINLVLSIVPLLKAYWDGGFGGMWEYMKKNWFGLGGEPETKDEMPIKKESKPLTEIVWDWLFEKFPMLKALKEGGFKGLLGYVGKGIVNIGKNTKEMASGAWDWGKSVLGFGDDKETKESKEALDITAKAISTMAEKSTDFGSLYTHDIHAEKILEEIRDMLRKEFGYENQTTMVTSSISDSLSRGFQWLGNSLSNVWDIGKKKITEWTGLGSISEKYESGGRGIGTISTGKGDLGGASYGTHQLASKTGTLQNFLKTSGYDKFFKGLTPGTREFNKMWKDLAAKDSKGFGQAQYDFIKRTHFNPMMEAAQKMGVDVNDKAIQEALWSIGVQHGAGGGKSLLENALGGKDISGMSKKDIINALYDERSKRTVSGELAYFKRNSLGVQASVSKRLVDERKDVMGLVRKPSSRVETAQAESDKVAKEVYEKRKEEEAKDRMARDETNKVLRLTSMKQDKYQSDMSKQSSINNNMMASVFSGGGGRMNDIPEEVDNYLLGLSVAGVFA